MSSAYPWNPSGLGLTIGQRAKQAIEWECSAIKAGNVHPRAGFSDLNHQHFLLAATAIGKAIDQMPCDSVGATALGMVEAMIQNVSTNTSLGTILLFAPLVVTLKRSDSDMSFGDLQHEVGSVLNSLTPSDAQDIYHAIRLAKPGGMGTTDEMDIREAPPEDILVAMRLAADRDDVALQFVSNFELVFSMAKRLKERLEHGVTTLDAIRWLQIQVLAERIDSLIARKQGVGFAREVQSRAQKVLHSWPYGSPGFEISWNDFDRFLRDANHRGNPGTIADLIAAAIFIIDPPKTRVLLAERKVVVD